MKLSERMRLGSVRRSPAFTWADEVTALEARAELAERRLKAMIEHGWSIMELSETRFQVVFQGSFVAEGSTPEEAIDAALKRINAAVERVKASD